eukprot:scaffold329212_cov52-Tisochrysis_lutea.AAC.1
MHAHGRKRRRTPRLRREGRSQAEARRATPSRAASVDAGASLCPGRPCVVAAAPLHIVPCLAAAAASPSHPSGAAVPPS